jgi:hypothetical protein
MSHDIEICVKKELFLVLPRHVGRSWILAEYRRILEEESKREKPENEPEVSPAVEAQPDQE